MRRMDLDGIIMNGMGKVADIPREPFWDIDPAKIDLRKNKAYIIERILETGDDKAVKWLFGAYSREEIKETLAGSRRISRKSSSYWAMILE